MHRDLRIAAVTPGSTPIIFAFAVRLFTGGSFLSPLELFLSSTASFDRTPLENELAELLVSALNLEVAPESIDPEAPLYGDGLGLDSIDILEVALEISRRYGFQLRSDDERNQQIFASLRALAAHVAANKAG